MKKIGLVTLPDLLSEQVRGFTNLHGWWTPPLQTCQAQKGPGPCLQSFSATKAVIEFDDGDDFELLQNLILESHKAASTELQALLQHVQGLTANAHRMLWEVSGAEAMVEELKDALAKERPS